MQEFHGEIQNGDLILPASQLVQRQNYLRSFKDGSLVTEVIKKTTRGKTWSQCKLLFGLGFATILAKFEEWGYDTSYILKIDKPTGVGVTDSMLKDFFYSMYPTYRDEKRITLRDMTTTEAGAYYESIRNFASSQWSIWIPECDPDWDKKKDNK